MAPIDGAIGMKIDINLPQTTDVNISKAQPSKASGLGGVRCLRSKSALSNRAEILAVDTLKYSIGTL